MCHTSLSVCWSTGNLVLSCLLNCNSVTVDSPGLNRGVMSSVLHKGPWVQSFNSIFHQPGYNLRFCVNSLNPHQFLARFVSVFSDRLWLLSLSVVRLGQKVCSSPAVASMLNMSHSHQHIVLQLHWNHNPRIPGHGCGRNTFLLRKKLFSEEVFLSNSF